MNAPIPPEAAAAFVARSPDAAMITRRPDGNAHVARVEVAVVDGQLRSTCSATLVRIRNLRTDPRSTLFLFDEHPWWLGLETETTIIEGPTAGPALVEFLRARHPDTPEGWVMAHDEEMGQDRLVPEAEYLARAAVDELLLVEFAITRAYGNVPDDPDGV